MTTDTTHRRTGNRHPLVTSGLEAAYRLAKATEIMKVALEKIAKPGYPSDIPMDEDAARGMVMIARSALIRAERMMKEGGINVPAEPES